MKEELLNSKNKFFKSIKEIYKYIEINCNKDKLYEQGTMMVIKEYSSI